MAEYIIRYEVTGKDFVEKFRVSEGLKSAIDIIKTIWEPNEFQILYVIRVAQYSNGFNIEMFQRGSWEELLK